jgi:hypothetical protein
MQAQQNHISLTQTAHFRTRQPTTYVACLNCGAEFVYDWKRMRLGLSLPTYASVTPISLECLEEQAVVGRLVC